MAHTVEAPGAHTRGRLSCHEYLKVFAIALAYFAAHQIAFFFPDSEEIIMLVWPAGGVALAALLLNPRRLWPALTVAFYISGVAADVLLADRSFLTGVGYMTGNMVESLGCAWLITYWVGGDFRNFTRVNEILALIVGAIVVNAFSACIGAGASVLTCGASFWNAWQSWYIADGLGVLLIGPFLVAWITMRESVARPDARRLLEGAACMTVWALITWRIFQADQFAFYFHPYFLVALLAWPAMRLGQRGVTLAILVLFAIAVVSQPIANGPSPWDARESTMSDRLLELQVFLGFMAIVGYLLAAGYTGLVRAENELRWKTAFLEAQVNSSLDGILVVDPQQKKLLGNQRLVDLWGVPQHILDDPDDASLLQHVVSLTKHPEEFYKKVTYLYEHPGETSRDEVEFNSGMVLDRYSSAVLGKDGEYYGRIWTFRDITDRKQAEETLRESEERFRTIFEEAPMGVALIDSLTGHIHEVNPRFAEIAGRTKEEMAAIDWMSITHPDDVQEDLDRMALLNAGKIPGYSMEKRYRRPDGSYVWINLTVAPVTVKDKSHPRHLAMVEDITERKRTEDALRKSTGELQRYAVALESSNEALQKLNHVAQSATRAKSEFLANMSHEIRTPMTAILGYADFLLAEAGFEKAPPHRREAIETIKRNGKHLLALINDILDLSKVESGKMEIQRVRCSPLALLAEVVSLMRVRAADRSLLLEAEAAGPLPETVLTDPLRLRQVLVNLVGNAVKFTDQGGVRVVARLVCDGSPQGLRFDVTDTGIGMNEEQMAKLFRPFSQVDNSAARRYSGTGLGLAISQRLVEALDGAIEVRSVAGKGSTFSVTIDPGPLDGIPLVQQTDLNVQPSPPAATPVAGGEIELHARVLLAEDGPDNQRLICHLLRKAGADVVAVENGQLAVEAALAQIEAGHPFDVILMDMQMPVMDGYTATRSLRQHGYVGPIVALTAHAMAEDRQDCLDAGCDDYTTKPIDRQRLLATVARWAARPTSDRDGSRSDRVELATTGAVPRQASPQDPAT